MAIDYTLLIISRFREQLVAGNDPPEAAARANATCPSRGAYPSKRAASKPSGPTQSPATKSPLAPGTLGPGRPARPPIRAVTRAPVTVIAGR